MSELPNIDRLKKYTKAQREKRVENELEQGCRAVAQIIHDNSKEGLNGVTHKALREVTDNFRFVRPHDLMKIAKKQGYDVDFQIDDYTPAISWEIDEDNEEDD